MTNAMDELKDAKDTFAEYFFFIKTAVFISFVRTYLFVLLLISREKLINFSLLFSYLKNVKKQIYYMLYALYH